MMQESQQAQTKPCMGAESKYFATASKQHADASPVSIHFRLCSRVRTPAQSIVLQRHEHKHQSTEVT
eukprot:CAMPEP_0174362236 /NCGR_PEP_ID=MMETSP0811_2-20130205/63356_1 /TAXON_ID=73025 ORGANISM="Eutreptiella gymnastica-like, Strain CCMP1594" /NCGR_SAMPLE_ID=MMETSP0811_2 /ASSEMBLY_ACC=CAM_ASM_000667 /LENGTH=66 /DNA_ID=CAMNT_0015499711 /DNA_START=159 /DNA_END=359 /DNA_ORIENTATION=-